MLILQRGNAYKALDSRRQIAATIKQNHLSPLGVDEFAENMTYAALHHLPFVGNETIFDPAETVPPVVSLLSS